MTSYKNDVIEALLTDGYTKQDILDAIKDTEIRLLWTLNSSCSIYSRRNKSWCNGQIMDIHIDQDSNQEWLTVAYNQTSKKQIQRFNQSIKPIDFEYDYNYKIIAIIAHKLKALDQVDLSLFENSPNQSRHDQDYSKCPILHRLFTALQFYSNLNISENAEHCDIFADFITNTYDQLLNDNIHLINEHNHQLQQINEGLIKKCCILQCDLVSRHHSFNNNLCSITDDRLRFFSETMDAIHFYLFHCFDAGLRSITEDTQNEIFDQPQWDESTSFRFPQVDDVSNESESDDYFDGELDRINSAVMGKQSVTDGFHRFSQKNGKFIIKKFQNKCAENDATPLDGLFIHLHKTCLMDSDIERLGDYIQLHEYDTESIEYDIANDKYINPDQSIMDISNFYRNSMSSAPSNPSVTSPLQMVPSNAESPKIPLMIPDNISNYETDSQNIFVIIGNNGNIYREMGNEQCMKEIKQFITETKVSSLSFNIGLRFYYWPHYASMNQLSEKEKNSLGEHDHSGYNLSELYVKKKYETFKEEITNYKCITIQEYTHRILIKVTLYQNTSIVKATKAVSGMWTGTEDLHYEIEEKAVLSFPHLLALVLYTDYNELCHNFVETFSKLGSYETIKSVRNRNREYFWLSKLLRECVEIYGECRFGDSYRDFDNKLAGPFYCGMSAVRNMPSFNISLCAPTSTTLHIETAVKFIGDKGMVIELNNPETQIHQWLRAFDVSWLSKYKEEDERLFFGGYYRIRIDSVRIRATTQNFERFITSLHYLDTMITGGKDMKVSGKDIDISEKSIEVIHDLIECLLGKVFGKQRIDPYVYSTFCAFLQNKREILLDLRAISMANEGMRDLFMYAMEERPSKSDNQREENDLSNLFKAEVIFGVFKNVKTIIIQTTNKAGHMSYSVSMRRLLSFIESSQSLKKVTIKARKRKCWIKKLWSLSAESLKKEYNSKGFSIYTKNVYTDDEEYWIVINKKS